MPSVTRQRKTPIPLRVTNIKAIPNHNQHFVCVASSSFLLIGYQLILAFETLMVCRRDEPAMVSCLQFLSAILMPKI
jgi:hypothetical protein